MDSTEKLLSESAVRLKLGGVSRMTIRRWEQRGLLTGRRKITGRNYWPESSIATLLEKSNVDANKVDAA